MNMIPDWQAKLLENGKGVNYALYFSRMTSWRPSGGELKAEYLARVVQTKNGPRDEYAPDIERLSGKAHHILPTASALLKAIHTRQTDILKTESGRGVMVWEFRVRLLSSFVSGLGSGHPTETGMILDRNTGLPYIPASAVKGVLRLACALEIAETEPGAVVPSEKEPDHLEIRDDHATLRRYFGDTDTGKADSVRGQLVFLDAYPASTPIIKPDIMNPHFGKYYSGAQGPLETENPNPVKFLIVAPATEFVFRCFASPLPEQGQRLVPTDVFRPFDVMDEQSVIAMFERAFSQLGFGSKTSIGYGRFALSTTNNTDHFRCLVTQDIELRRQAEEQRRQKEEERLYPWRRLLADLERISDWGPLRQKIMDNKHLQEHQAQQEVGERVKAAAQRVREANPKRWKSDWDSYLQQWLTPSGMTWSAAEDVGSGTAGKGGSDIGLTPEEREQEERIAALHSCDSGKKWEQVKKIMETIDQLSEPAVLKLQDVFKTEKWDKNNVKKDKKEAWEKLRKRRKQLRGI